MKRSVSLTLKLIRKIKIQTRLPKVIPYRFDSEIITVLTFSPYYTTVYPSDHPKNRLKLNYKIPSHYLHLNE